MLGGIGIKCRCCLIQMFPIDITNSNDLHTRFAGSPAGIAQALAETAPASTGTDQADIDLVVRAKLFWLIGNTRSLRRDRFANVPLRHPRNRHSGEGLNQKTAARYI